MDPSSFSNKTLPEQSFEEALKELESIVQKFENNAWTLDQAVEAYKRGLLLKEICSQKLEAAKLVMETVSKSSEEGNGTSSPDNTLFDATSL